MLCQYQPNAGPSSTTLAQHPCVALHGYISRRPVCWVVGGGEGGGAGAVVEAACLESRRSRVLVPLWHPNFKETKCFFPAHAERLNIVGKLRDREVVCSGSNRQGSNFELCFLRAVSSHSSHHHQEVLLAQFNLHVHKGGQKPHSLHLLGSDFNTCSAFNTTSDESIYLHVAQQVIKSELD